MWKPEAATRSVLSKNYSCKFCKFHKKAPVLESLFSKESPTQVFFCKICEVIWNTNFEEHLINLMNFTRFFKRQIAFSIFKREFRFCTSLQLHLLLYHFIQNSLYLLTCFLSNISILYGNWLRLYGFATTAWKGSCCNKILASQLFISTKSLEKQYSQVLHKVIVLKSLLNFLENPTELCLLKLQLEVLHLTESALSWVWS